jgi:hypothetical protein
MRGPARDAGIRRTWLQREIQPTPPGGIGFCLLQRAANFGKDLCGGYGFHVAPIKLGTPPLSLSEPSFFDTASIYRFKGLDQGQRQASAIIGRKPPGAFFEFSQ